MKKLSIDPDRIQSVIISHDHWDHTGGLERLLKLKSALTIYVPDSIDEATEKTIHSYGADVERITKSKQLQDGIFTLGEMVSSRIPEQSIVISTGKGLILLTGCAHPGIVNIIQKVQLLFPTQPIHLVMGGFHLIDDTEQTINDIIHKFRGVNIESVAPSHCTGELALRIMRDNYKDKFIRSGVGCIIHIN
jgi:7,8-dihydropterin-6-yl-methyl-4-(beta-D-ribofuranosyl)aminobenzene 5'-phosphate synthase